ncbi:hypothetical protein [Deinococcus sp.]|uniref:hypothetical protein n=1 Tax=Deinococcus sp. TaxID=47478 RepID=UPI0025D38824|nr:hypothetical protein [Deinococcus sp.]
MSDPPEPPHGPPHDAPHDAQLLGIQFTLQDMSEINFAKVLNDIMHDHAFARPLQVQVIEPRPDRQGGFIDGQLTLAFFESDRERAAAAMQRLKTILLRYGAQVDHIRMPGEERLN